jgi:hypothetical protein
MSISSAPASRSSSPGISSPWISDGSERSPRRNAAASSSRCSRISATCSGRSGRRPPPLHPAGPRLLEDVGGLLQVEGHHSRALLRDLSLPGLLLGGERPRCPRAVPGSLRRPTPPPAASSRAARTGKLPALTHRPPRDPHRLQHDSRSSSGIACRTRSNFARLAPGRCSRPSSFPHRVNPPSSPPACPRATGAPPPTRDPSASPPGG